MKVSTRSGQRGRLSIQLFKVSYIYDITGKTKSRLTHSPFLSSTYKVYGSVVRLSAPASLGGVVMP